MKTKITESELASRSASLREKMAQLENQQANEGWFDDAVGGVKKFFGGGEQPAAAPAPAAAPPAPAAPAPVGTAPATGPTSTAGQPGSTAAAQVGSGTTPPAANSGSARIKNYAEAMRQIKDLYAKAKVQYPPQDDIVRQRYGLPPALPAIGQWDGKMPQSTGADFLTRNLLGRDASKAVAGQQAANNISNTASAKSDAETAADVQQLNTLVAQAKDMLAGKGPAPVSLNEHMPTNLLESIARLNKKIRLLEDPAQDQAKAAIIAKSQAGPELDTTGKDNSIKAIQDLMAKINGNNEDPPEDVAKALSDAQAVLDQFKDMAAKNPVAPVSLAQNNGVNAQGQNIGVQGMDGSMINPETGEKYSTGINPETGELYTPLPAGSSQVPVQASLSPGEKIATPGKAINPETGEEYTPVAPTNTAAAPAKSINPETGEEYTPVAPTNTAAAPTQKKYGGYGQATAESVSYRDDQALARIVQLSRR